MESIILKIENNLVKVFSEENNYLLHKFNCNDLSLKGILLELNKQQKKYDLNYYVEDIEFNNK